MQELFKALADDYRKLHEKLDAIIESVGKMNSPQNKLADEYVEIMQACTILGISRRTLYTLMEEGTIPYVQYNRKRKIRLTDLQAFLERSMRAKVGSLL
ncbi:MAG: hypothetical protein CFE24_14700 [Flavobacterium sp. BFFFF2]|nr:MAG: hypothetical protein CFE24_14700 [Flavobacterium sp. BFFFF2]